MDPQILAQNSAPDNSCPIESHHLLGRDLPAPWHDFTAYLPTNVHREVSALHAAWPAQLKAPTSNPLVILSRVLRSLADLCAVFAPLLVRFSDWLLALAEQVHIRGDFFDNLAPLWRRTEDST